MATSTGKTIGLILLLIVLVVLSLRLTPLILAPLGVFTGVFHMGRIPQMSADRFGPWLPTLSGAPFLSIFLFFIWAAVIIWVYRDAERRGMSGILWALLVFVGNLIGLLIYLIVRAEPEKAPPKERPSLACPKCQKPVEPGFAFCPHCGAAMQGSCPECGKPAEKGWKACPHCGTQFETGELP